LSDYGPDGQRARSDTYRGLRDLQVGAAAGGTPGHPLERPRSKRWPRRMLVLVNIFVALCLIGAGGAYGYVHHELGNVKKVNLAALSVAGAGPFTVLIVGSDTRALPGAPNASFGTAAQTPGQRSDTVMLARIVPKTRSITLLSIPRDLWVDIPGVGHSRINSAFNTGPNLLVTTIQKDLGIPINHFVEINFDTFESITDAVGGVKIWFPTPAMDALSLLNVPTAGCVNLTGAQALAFARSRHYQYKVDGQWLTQGLSDLARIQRQQYYVKKMIAKAERELTNPLALNAVLSSITKNLTVDRNFNTSLMIRLAEDFHSANVSGIPTETLPTYNEDIGGAAVLGLTQPAAAQMIASFNSLGNPQAAKKKAATSPSTVTATTVPGSHVAVLVANGSGVTGQAGAAATAIGALGYRATVTGQTPGYGFASNTIDYAPGAHHAAEALAAQLAGGATLQASSTLGSTPYTLELVTGHDYAGVGGSHAGSTTSTSSATATPTTAAPKASGSTLDTAYPLPGPAPTEAQLAAC
jgi:LCP family protein required for cell wall assembly